MSTAWALLFSFRAKPVDDGVDTSRIAEGSEMGNGVNKHNEMDSDREIFGCVGAVEPPLR